MSRRRAVEALAIAPLSTLVHTVPSQPRRVTFVLVHGAWHGGWCYRRLARLLRTAGHDVFAPTLTGLGERSHLLVEEIDLDTHVKDVSAVLEYEDLRDVVLVGHSYGGMVITGVAGNARGRLSHLVYLDAFLPEDGKALQDYAPVPPVVGKWRVPPPGPPQAFGVTDERDIAWMSSRLGDHPLKTMTQPVRRGSPDAALKRAFIQCSTARFFAEAAERAKRQGYESHSLLSAGHDAMMTQPSELAAILLGIASS